MGGSADRRAALLLLGLAGTGLAVRLVAGGLAAPGGIAYRYVPSHAPDRRAVVRDAVRLARPLAAGERVDLDRAPAAELVRLPRIGPSLAARIVADREERGPFGSLAALGRVPGIGEATLAALKPYAAFSHPARPAAAGRGSPVPVNQATEEQLTVLPGIGPALAAAIVAERRRGGAFRSLEDLRRVRGIGPAVLRRLEGRIRIP